MDNSLFRGRLIKVSFACMNCTNQVYAGYQVTAKRTNIPGFNRGRGRGRGGYRGGYRGHAGYSPYSRGRGRWVICPFCKLLLTRQTQRQRPWLLIGGDSISKELLGSLRLDLSGVMHILYVSSHFLFDVPDST